ncbi:MAG TPA: aminoglycoside phosphotransferase family protein [Acidimicrobiales bacterium]|nr:aminoglycoside phosphotransferase family protein [Acidimicrobiales bacterium]
MTDVPVFDTDEEYERALTTPGWWEALVFEALSIAGLPRPASVRSGLVGTYPTYVTDTGLVVKIYGDRYAGPESHLVETEAYASLADAGLPVPSVVATGELASGRRWPWPFLVTTVVAGVPWGQVASKMTRAARVRTAGELGVFLRRLHDLPLRGRIALTSSWDRFESLLARRRRDAPSDHFRWNHLPPILAAQVDAWLPSVRELIDESAPPVFVHGDLHADHVFVDPATGALLGVIDFTDASAGDRRYDLPAIQCSVFRGYRPLLAALLEAYGATFDPRELLAFALLHDFDMFEVPAALDPGLGGVRTLDALATRLFRV